MTDRFDARLSAEDERALSELSARYAVACDMRDRHGFCDLFTDDVVVMVHYAAEDRPRVAVGLENVGRVPEQLTRYAKTFHMLGQSTYAEGEEPGTATGEIYCVGHHITGTEPIVDVRMHLRYHDDYRHTDNGWRISRREVFVDFTTTEAVTWAAGLSARPPTTAALRSVRGSG
ncbi:nuclear transport factor 2 family protein [Nocardioides sp. cx-173]|uniref:nuclear transport factor 2 family protein n=1 Tax=Nocardioides sp. cx-173 TaxID=2898796 RepID=UPI001E5B00E6|nr:nuclear transport factor 2 family protein [Nocardioides sp. cx-173]MCD4524280.1 nuclear transport factor 2 family protein [Nocardioides sp. cx-173]UGB41672.1 nuclear transport factor 2 family protein [Nocardioides sp. cx-173]